MAAAIPIAIAHLAQPRSRGAIKSITMTTVSVLFVHQRDAKIIKTQLENKSFLDKRYRMTTVSLTGTGCGGEADRNIDGGQYPGIEITWCHEDNNAVDKDRCDYIATEDDRIQKCIAVPITEECMDRVHRQYRHHQYRSIKSGESNHSSAKDDNRDNYIQSIDDGISSEVIYQRIIGFGRCKCLYSSSMLGNNKFVKCCQRRGEDVSDNQNHVTACDMKLPCSITSDKNQFTSCSSNENGDVDSLPLTNIQHILSETLIDWLHDSDNDQAPTNNIARNNTRQKRPQYTVVKVEQLVRGLSIQTCPKKLETIGDDRTLVIPRWSFFIVSNNAGSSGEVNATTFARVKKMQQEQERLEFVELLRQLMHDEEGNDRDVGSDDIILAIMCALQSRLWMNLATSYSSSRIVRRGDVDPDSGIRESGHRILWPIPDDESITVCNQGHLPVQTGVNSPGWITVTEHKIAQSFDITRVMFSRGNVTEKKRFGMSLVKPGESVLDMYAGIGYYTLPALIHGKAMHVTACEWNEHALYALKHNLKTNGIREDFVTVLEGDCRLALKRYVDRVEPVKDSKFDRISLGLLPSSEGGWSIAVSCLRKSTGGWLHVHGNVATVEHDNWSHWLCHTLVQHAVKDGHSDWIAVCNHIEKVKSFAPKVDHVVADVFVGPPTSSKVPTSWRVKTTGVFNSAGRFVATSSVDISLPSCALNEDGILHQSWMRE